MNSFRNGGGVEGVRPLLGPWGGDPENLDVLIGGWKRPCAGEVVVRDLDFGGGGALGDNTVREMNLTENFPLDGDPRAHGQPPSEKPEAGRWEGVAPAQTKLRRQNAGLPTERFR